MEHRRIPVLRGDKSIYWLKIADICFASIDGKRITYHTKDEIFYQINNFDELLRLLTPTEGFEKLDRAVVIRMSNVTRFDSETGLVYFDEPVNRHSKFATVASGYIQKVKKMMGRDRGMNHNNE